MAKAKRDEVSGVVDVQGEARTRSEAAYPSLPAPKRRGWFARYAESAFVVAAILGIVGLTSLLAIAQYRSAKLVNTTLVTDLMR